MCSGSGLMRVPTTYGEGGLGRTGPGGDVGIDADRLPPGTRRCRLRMRPKAVRSICVTSQWSSIVPVDANGLPVAPLHMWFDRRGEKYTAALTAATTARRSRRAGQEIHGFVPEHRRSRTSCGFNTTATSTIARPRTSSRWTTSTLGSPADRGDCQLGHADGPHRQPPARRHDVVCRARRPRRCRRQPPPRSDEVVGTCCRPSEPTLPMTSDCIATSRSSPEPTTASPQRSVPGLFEAGQGDDHDGHHRRADRAHHPTRHVDRAQVHRHDAQRTRGSLLRRCRRRCSAASSSKPR